MLAGEVGRPARAFLIGPSIRRPSPVELAGMLDSYRARGPGPCAVRLLLSPGEAALVWVRLRRPQPARRPCYLLALMLAAAARPICAARRRIRMR